MHDFYDCIDYIFILKEFFKRIFGCHYPKEIIKLIIMFSYTPHKIFSGYNQNFLISRKLFAWGGNRHGQLGLKNCEPCCTPYKLGLLNRLNKSDIKLICCGSIHTIALMKTGIIYVWGHNNENQLGFGDYIDRYSPKELVFSKKHRKYKLPIIESISCGSNHTIALTKSGTMYSWGDNGDGQLGIGDYCRHKIIYELKVSMYSNKKLPQMKLVSCGENNTVAVSYCNEIYAWGCNEFGQLGFGNNNDNDHTFPERLKLPTRFDTSGIDSISCGSNHTVCLTKSGKIYVWGDNSCRQLGLGDDNDRYFPRELILPKKYNELHVRSIICGGYHTVALTKCNTLYVWGDNDEGQLGLGDTNEQYKPQKLSLTNVESVSCGLLHTTAITYFGQIYVWGQNCFGQLGLADRIDCIASPKKFIF